MKSHGGLTRGGYRHSPPFLLIGLLVVILILVYNYWTASTRSAELQRSYEKLRDKFEEELQLKQQLEGNNANLETRVKKVQETHDNLRNSLDKKEEEALQCKETLASFQRDRDLAKSEEEKKLLFAQEKLRKSEENATKQILIHDQDASLISSLRDENSKLAAQLSALRESLDHATATAASSLAASVPSQPDCNQHCLILVEAAQKRLFDKILKNYGQDALQVLESSDFGVPRRPGKMFTGEPPQGKLPDDVLVVGRDGKILSGGVTSTARSSASSPKNNNNNNAVDESAKSSTIATNDTRAIASFDPPVASIDDNSNNNNNKNMAVADVIPAPFDVEKRKLEDQGLAIDAINGEGALLDSLRGGGVEAVAPKPRLIDDDDDEAVAKMQMQMLSTISSKKGFIDDVAAGGNDDDGGGDDIADGGEMKLIAPGEDINDDNNNNDNNNNDNNNNDNVGKDAKQEPLLGEIDGVKDGIDELHNNLDAAEANDGPMKKSLF